MSDKNLQETSKKENINVISSLINREAAQYNLTVEAQIQYGINLWLKIYSPTPTALNAEPGVQFILELLNIIKPKKILSLHVSIIASGDRNKRIKDRYFTFKEGRLIETTNTINSITFLILALIIGGCGWLLIPTREAPTTDVSSAIAILNDL